MREREEDFRAAGASIGAIGLGDMNYARLFREEAGITFPLFVDEKRLAYKTAELKSGSVLHLLRGDNASARSQARAAGHSQHALGSNPFQLGGSFVFGPGNRELFAHVSKTFGDNAPIETLLEVVQRASRG